MPTVHGVDLPGRGGYIPDLYDLYDLYDLAHVAGWQPYNLHDLHDLYDLHCTDPAQHLTTAGWDLDDLYHDRSPALFGVVFLPLHYHSPLARCAVNDEVNPQPTNQTVNQPCNQRTNQLFIGHQPTSITTIGPILTNVCDQPIGSLRYIIPHYAGLGNIQNTRFPSGKRLGEWRKNETKSIQRETNTTTPEIAE